MLYDGELQRTVGFGNLTSKISAPWQSAVVSFLCLAQVLYDELEAYAAVKEGLINDAEARAINAKAQVDASDDKIAAVENEMNLIQEAYDRGEITLDQYNKRMDEAYKSMDGLTKERIANEKAASEALKAAIESRIAEYEREAQAVADNIQKINTAIGQIQQVRGTGISAFKTLAQEVTNAEIQGIDQVKDKRNKRKSVQVFLRSYLRSYARTTCPFPARRCRHSGTCPCCWPWA